MSTTYFKFCCIGSVSDHLSVDSAKTLASAFVLCRLKYCNSLLSCLKHLEKLEKVQNSAARLVLKAHKQDHVSPLLNKLLAAYPSTH